MQQHARCKGGQFQFRNLVPKCDVQLWQHAPHVPFDKLQSHTSKQRLSICKLDHSVKDAGVREGRPMYASHRGDTNLWKRNPEQVSGTLAFLLAKDEGRELNLRSAEVLSPRMLTIPQSQESTL